MSIQEQAYLSFALWEIRLRGIHVYDYHIDMEPQFLPFVTHLPFLQDGRKEIAKKWWQFRTPKVETVIDEHAIQEYFALPPVKHTPTKTTTFEIVLTDLTPSTSTQIQQLLQTISTFNSWVSIEIIGAHEEIVILITSSILYASILQRALKIIYPSLRVYESSKTLEHYAKPHPHSHSQVHTYGLKNECIIPLSIPHKELHSLDGLLTIMETLQQDEIVVYQIAIQGTSVPWSNHMSRVYDKMFQKDDAVQLGSKTKLNSFLCFVNLRTLIHSNSSHRINILGKLVKETVIQSSTSSYNQLCEVSNNKTDIDVKIDDVINRVTCQSGMLLSVDEISSFIHIPPPHLQTGKLALTSRTTVEVPQILTNNETILGVNSHHGIINNVTVNTEQRLRHTHIIGATGTGKSTLLLSMMKQDLDNGNGFMLLDPHGDLIDDLVGHIPEERKDDVILIDPSDMEFPLGVNIMSAESETQKIVLSSDLTGLFKRFSTSWGDQMEAILSNAINTLLEHKDAHTLVHLRQFLSDKNFRKEILATITDTFITNFWEYDFPTLRKNSITSIITRLDTFLRPKVIRGMMNQTGGVDFGKVIQSKKIVLVKLAQGIIGTSNSYLLGSLLVAKLYQYTQERQLLDANKRHPYYLYIDEFQNFITPSMEALLSGARKFGLGLILAHQNIEQLQRNNAKITNSLLANAGVQVVFRVGVSDGKKLEQGFAHFSNKDFQELSIGEAILRVQRSDWDCNISTALLPYINGSTIYEYIQKQSREKYSTQEVVESHIGKQEESKVPVVVPMTNEGQPPIVEETKERDIKKEIEEFKTQERKRINERTHRKMQKTIQSIGQRYNWGAYIEHKVSNPDGFIDVALHIDNIKIAVEISVTNTTHYEVQNIQKYLNNGYDVVFMCCNNSSHLQAIEKRATTTIQSKYLKKVRFGNMEALDRFLHIIHTEQKPKTKTIRGYKVKVGFKESIGLGSRDELIDTVLKSLRK